MNTLKLVICVSSLSFLSMNAQNPTFYTAERVDNSGASLNLKNANGFWHFSGPRSYETNNKLSIFWNNGTYHRLLSINDDGKVGIGTSSPGAKLEVSSSNATHAIFKGSFAGIQGIQIERESGDNIRLVANYSGYGGGLESSSKLRFAVNGNNIDTPAVLINESGNVGIGTTTPDAKLTVKGDIHAEEVKVDLSVPGPDYVFKEDYDLKPLEEVQNFIKENGHLPNIPSAQEMEKNGIQLGEMNMKLLEKIEELTLYILEQERKLEKMDYLENEIKEMKKLIKQSANMKI